MLLCNVFYIQDNPLGTGGRLMTAFARLTTLIWKKIPKTVSAPRMREIRQAVIKISPQFDGYDQQDAQEFLAFLMDGLHEDINRVKQKIYFTEPDTDKNTVEKSKVRLERLAAESWQRHLLRNKSRLVDLFQGQLMSTVTCLTCKFYSLKFDPVMYLSLPVVRNDNQKPVKTLNEAFEAFSQDEELSSSNMWICPNCKNHQKAVKKIEIWILPPVLIVHLKRFSFDKIYKKTTKLDHFIDCPLTNLIAPVKDPTLSQSSYDLYAVVNHTGRNLSFGHYTAACCLNSRGSSKNHRWRLFDDEDVSPINEKDVMTKGSYLLFYLKRGVKPEFISRQSLSKPEDWPHAECLNQNSKEELTELSNSGTPAGVTPPPRAGVTPSPRAGVTPSPQAGITPSPRAGVTPSPQAGVTPPPVKKFEK
eukprot:GHVL01019983.1.p1 GENE.GHVL01019983.1~~GHVL01019983.1.p1  ORF type:complete len:418 (-),score=86.81 GHVL01019983.1:231-1484(-)